MQELHSATQQRLLPRQRSAAAAVAPTTRSPAASPQQQHRHIWHVPSPASPRRARLACRAAAKQQQVVAQPAAPPAGPPGGRKDNMLAIVGVCVALWAASAAVAVAIGGVLQLMGELRGLWGVARAYALVSVCGHEHTIIITCTHTHHTTTIRVPGNTRYLQRSSTAAAWSSDYSSVLDDIDPLPGLAVELEVEGARGAAAAAAGRGVVGVWGAGGCREGGGDVWVPYAQPKPANRTQPNRQACAPRVAVSQAAVEGARGAAAGALDPRLPGGLSIVGVVSEEEEVGGKGQTPPGTTTSSSLS
jgi:hypothetical protein